MTDPKTTFQQLNTNLQTLQQREAKYAGNAPLELLNQITDHQKAIDLTRQVIANEITEAEWREAMEPLLVSLEKAQVIINQQGQQVEGQVNVAGDVAGDAIGQQIITNIYEAPPLPLPPAEAKDRQNLGILLNKVKTFWIEGVLEKSIHNVALIDLGKETHTDAVDQPWKQVLELPDQSRQTIPSDKKISRIFEEMNRALLILGEPGSGKTITLLQLAQELIAQCEADETFSQPVPVVFNLSSWSETQQPLIDWLVLELSAKYQIPKKIGRPWLENNRLLPLLDGLDEMKPENQVACVEAINHFNQEFGLAGVVVCSRIEEYSCLPVRLKLNGAIRLQSLTIEQVHNYLDTAGPKLAALHTALQTDEGLQELAQSPLTLDIMTLTYQDMPVEALSSQAEDPVKARRTHLFDTYIERMFTRKGTGDKHCSDEQTKDWLTWLAYQMSQRNQSLFLIEGLQPNWLQTQHWRWLYILISRLSGGLIFGLILGFLYDGLIYDLDHGLTFGMILGLSIGLPVCFIDLLRLEWLDKYRERIVVTHYWWQIINIMVVGLIVGLIVKLTNLDKDSSFALNCALIFGLIYGLRGSRQSLINDIRTIEALHWSWGKALKGGIVGGLLGQITNALFIGLLVWEEHFKPEDALSECLDGKVFLMAGLIGAVFYGLNYEILKTKTKPNQGIRLSVRNAVFGGLIVGLSLGLIGGLTIGLSYGLFVGLIAGLLGALWYGGLDAIQHFTLRFILWRTSQLPYRLVPFLDYCADRIFLRKVGGGYIFIHRLLLEHFAAMHEPAPSPEN